MSKNRLEMPSVLITGANGWLGRSAISVLTERYPYKFRIYASSSCIVNWTVFAKRKDIELNVEVHKDDIEVKGDGPYKWI